MCQKELQYFDPYLKPNDSPGPWSARGGFLEAEGDEKWPAVNPKYTFKILCFGASLVKGHTDGGMRNTPYSWEMKKVLEETWGIGKLENVRRVSVQTSGVSGELARDMGERMERVCGYISFDLWFFFVYR